MKRLLLALVLLLIVSTIHAQERQVRVHHQDVSYDFNVGFVDSITFHNNAPAVHYDVCKERYYNDKFTNDGFLNRNGVIGHFNEGYLFTDFISVNNAVEIRATACINNKAGGGICFYDDSQNFISSICDIHDSNIYDTNNYEITIDRKDFPSNAKYIRAQSGRGKKTLSIVFNISSIETIYLEPHFSNNNKVLQPKETLSLPLNYIRKNTLLTVSLSFNQFEKITMGRGEKSYQGYYLEIDTSAVVLYNYTNEPVKLCEFKHNLKISRDLTVTIDYQDGNTGNIVMMSNGKIYTDNIKWWGGGATFVRNEGTEQIFASVTFVPKDICMPVWFIADSYFHWNSPKRWPYYIVNKGYVSWMADHKPGMASAEASECFYNDLTFGNPRYAVWCMGMNDKSDIDSPDKTWLDCVNSFIDMCNKNGITPILCTIPSVPTRNHKEKTKWVRDSGYRYVDMCKAVGADDTVDWYDGMLDSDGVHPSEAGAEALADRSGARIPLVAHQRIPAVAHQRIPLIAVERIPAVAHPGYRLESAS